MKGLLVTFEGVEGAGKTTLLDRLAGGLRARGKDPLVTREPGGTAAGAALRGVLLDPAHRGMDPLCELALIAADRAQHVTEVLLPALAAGRTVLCDRFSDATFAYQGGGRGVPAATVAAFDDPVRRGVWPHLTVLVDLPAETGVARARGRNREGDVRETRLDDEELAFHRRVREAYLARAAAEPGRFLVLDGSRSPEALADDLLREFGRRYPRAL